MPSPASPGVSPSTARAGRRRRLAHARGQAEGERAALAVRARHRDVAAHQAGQPPGEREAEPRAPEAPGHARIGLAEALEEPRHLLGRHADPGVGHREGQPVPARAGGPLDGQRHRSAFRELARIAEEIEQRLAHLGEVGVHAARLRPAPQLDPVPVLLRQGLDDGRDVPHQRRHLEVLEVELHAPGLDLGQIEHAVDQLEEVLAGGVDLLEVGDEGLLRQVLGLLLEHLAVADDRVERRAQLVRHVRHELRLVPARHLDLPALLLELPEEARVLDGQRRLGGEGPQQLDHLRRELAGRVSVHDEAADEVILAEQGHREHGPRARADEDVAEPAVVGALDRDVRDLGGLVGDRHAPGGALALPEPDPPPQLEILIVEIVRGAERELLGRLVVLVDRAAVGARELGGAGDDGRQHRVEIERRADGPARRRRGR